MELSDNLLKQFASIINDGENSKSETTVYGTVINKDGSVYVKLDGANVPTPVSMTMEAQEGDRVMVLLKNHTATIIGNVSSPASARSANGFMKRTEYGLIVGELDGNGDCTGIHLLMTPEVFNLIDVNGNILASFARKPIENGNKDDSEISLLGDKINIKIVGDDIALNSNFCSLTIRSDAIAFNTVNDAVVLINESELINSDNIIVSGSIKGSGKISSGAVVIVKKTITVPDGYRLAGIRQISIDNEAVCHLVDFFANPITNEVGIKLGNTGDSDITSNMVIEWFAIRSKGEKYSISDIINW